MPLSRLSMLKVVVVGATLFPWAIFASAQQDEPSMDVLTADEWEQVDDSVDRALAWLASQQQRDGSFPTLPQGQPGVTALCALAMLAHGHLPGEGPYGAELDRAIDFTVSCQKPNGLLAYVAPRGPTLTRNVAHELGVAIAYNHAIGSLLLGETYAMSGRQWAGRLQPVVQKSLEVSLTMQSWPKPRRQDRGGWRYLHPFRDIHSDLSVTGWQLMFLRSAKNAGFDVPNEPIEEAVEYVERCFSPTAGSFLYEVGSEVKLSRGVAGAGVLALAHAGHHNAEEAVRAGDWILRYSFENYNQLAEFPGVGPAKDRYHYGVFLCSQATYQLGGRYWREFFPRTVRTLLANQQTNGSWAAENHNEDGKFGSAYTTALVVLALGAPNQLLPVFQR